MNTENEPDPMSVKICGECDGRGTIATAGRLRCPACLGSCRYGYLASGQRVAYDAKRKEWRPT